MTRVAVIGGGIVGLAVARELLRRDRGQVVVFEKEHQLACHQTGHNSGVVHAGLYYAPGSLKARLCTRGRMLLRAYCHDRDLPYVECGKVVVALTPEELPRLQAIGTRARANGVEGLRTLDRDELRRVEPHAAGIEALHSPHTAIVDFRRVALAVADDVVDLGGEIRTGSPVTAIRRRGGEAVVTAGSTRAPFDLVVACAGAHSDRVARFTDDGADPRIVPFRGQYYRLVPEARALVRGLIYPVPDPRYPFLGVHLTRRVDGEVLVGPNALLALHREGYRLGHVRLRDTLDTLRWPGFRRMAAQHWRTGLREARLTVSRRAFAAEAARYVPEVRPQQLVRGLAGVRAQAVARDGTLVDDFRITGEGGVVHVRNAPSPAATSALAIAEHIVERL